MSWVAGPLAVDNPEHHGLVPARPPAPEILVVDDNAANLVALRAMLAPLGHDLIEVESGREALRAALGHTFALILMDVRMPVMNGYETARLIREHPLFAATPVIFVTAYGGDETEICRV